MLKTQKVVVFEDSVGAKLVNNYQQLSKIDGGKRGQQLSTIAMIMSGNNYSHNITDTIILTKKIKKNRFIDFLIVLVRKKNNKNP